MLTTVGTRINLTSCCGMEWLINSNTRFAFAPASLFCGINNTMVDVTLLQNRVRLDPSPTLMAGHLSVY